MYRRRTEDVDQGTTSRPLRHNRLESTEWSLIDILESVGRRLSCGNRTWCRIKTRSESTIDNSNASRRKILFVTSRDFDYKFYQKQQVRDWQAFQHEGAMKSRRETEREISQAIIRFEKEYMGRGPLETKSYIIEDMVLVRLKNVLTPAEMKLAEAEDRTRGRYLIKQVRQELIERGRPLLDAVVKDILDVDVVSLHTDISAKTGERVIVFVLESRPEFSGSLGVY